MLPVLLPRRGLSDESFWPMRRDLDRLSRRMWEEGPDVETAAMCPVDIDEDDEAVTVEAELPGFKKDEIDVSLDQGVLRISAERKTPAERKAKRHLTERCYARVERAFTLPTSVDESKIDAKLDDGVLTIRLPKGEGAKPRQISVK